MPPGPGPKGMTGRQQQGRMPSGRTGASTRLGRGSETLPAFLPLPWGAAVCTQDERGHLPPVPWGSPLQRPRLRAPRAPSPRPSLLENKHDSGKCAHAGLALKLVTSLPPPTPFPVASPGPCLSERPHRTHCRCSGPSGPDLVVPVELGHCVGDPRSQPRHSPLHHGSADTGLLSLCPGHTLQPSLECADHPGSGPGTASGCSSASTTTSGTPRGAWRLRAFTGPQLGHSQAPQRLARSLQPPRAAGPGANTAILAGTQLQPPTSFLAGGHPTWG